MVSRLASSTFFTARSGGVRLRIGAAVRRRPVTRNHVALAGLVGTAASIGIAAVEVSEGWFPPSALVLPVLAGGLLLRVRSLAVLLAAVALALAYDAASLGVGRVGGGLVATVAVTAVVAVLLARAREEIGVQGLRGEQMLLELRDRLKAQGELPRLPAEWEAQVVLGQAGGSSFGGDFVVSALSADRRTLEVAVVDVSGKGVDAGTRALLLSGAAGGLLASMPCERFLAAANAYLLRQGWEEGFATAVHLALDLYTGSYVIESAGHPPPVQFAAGSGTWRVTAGGGTALGVLSDVASTPERGVLRTGDALLLYTDGLIETPGRDIELGIDRLLGRAECLVTRGFRDGAGELAAALSSPNRDDCAIVLIWRT
ncbi:MAG: SpoIIE family protein phosphatase [Streptosporangiales bacterium]|nr:SpoIIE family protein phosphatase [Streptosporangiales bacterium]